MFPSEIDYAVEIVSFDPYSPRFLLAALLAALRCQRRLGRADAARLAQRFVRRYRAADFAVAVPEYSGESVYRLSSGEAVRLRRERHRSVTDRARVAHFAMPSRLRHRRDDIIFVDIESKIEFFFHWCVCLFLVV